MLERSLFDIEACIVELKKERHIFHSEADFKFAFAKAIANKFPRAKIRIEYPVMIETTRRYIDIVVFLMINYTLSN